MEAEPASSGMAFQAQRIPGTFRLLDFNLLIEFREGRAALGRPIWMLFCDAKKRSSQASWKHAAWELLSPDLRCFWKHHRRSAAIAQEYFCAMTQSNFLFTS